MVGADPDNCSGSACDVTVEADIIAAQSSIVGGLHVQTAPTSLAPTLASPQFAPNDYGSTPFATRLGVPPAGAGPGGASRRSTPASRCSSQDATMRAQFNKTGSSSYHLRLHPNVLPPVTINVPSNQGTLLQSGRGVIFAERQHRLVGGADQEPGHRTARRPDAPAALPHRTTSSCTSARTSLTAASSASTAPGRPATAARARGTATATPAVQTFAWASWVTPGIYARPNGGTDWALQDIHAISHEIAEWADDPFINNFVEPWLTPTAPQYGCTDVLETGDPVVDIGFAMGTNTFDRVRTRTARRAPTATTTPRTRSSCRGSCGPRRTPCRSRPRTHRPTSGATR